MQGVGQRQCHDHVTLRIAAELEDVLSRFAEAQFSVESDGSWIILPDTQPKAVNPNVRSDCEDFRHQRLGHAFPVPV